MKLTNYVNVFHGNGEINLPEAKEIVKNWVPIKALSGNTSPAATLPFGKYSVCAYSGGYTSGYGINKGNYGEIVPKLYENGMKIKGFSHFHNSGVGAITVYYNYAVVTPYYNENSGEYSYTDETACPGYYSVILKETNIKCELTVSEKAAFHRYNFNENGGKIAIDFLNNGLYDDPKFRGRVENLETMKLGGRFLRASVTLEGVRLHFAVQFIGNGCLNEENVFELTDKGSVTVKISVSAVSSEEAIQENFLANQTFDEAKDAADNKWENALSRVKIESDDIKEKEIFYSNLYHTLVKPNDWNGGSFLWKDGPFVVDFSTMWDIYKTQLPFVFSLYPKTSENIIGTLLNIGKTLNKFPNAFMLSNNFNIESIQARLLIVYTLFDAYKRSVKADWNEAFKTIKNCLNSEDFRYFLTNKNGERHTHTLDMSGVCYSVIEIAKDFNDNELIDLLEKHKDNWVNAFDESTGLLRTDSEYYEGNHRNYSFRLMPYYKKRVEICGSKENYVKLLDDFFGFNGKETPGNFEGFNNETDMETPYAYHYAERYDRICDILDIADSLVFRDKNGSAGPGAIPGNNDSGAISSCYIWNCLGIFPVSGVDEMLLSRPKFNHAKLLLANGKTLTISRNGNAKYPISAIFNGNEISKMKIKASELMNGGELIFNF